MQAKRMLIAFLLIGLLVSIGGLPAGASPAAEEPPPAAGDDFGEEGEVGAAGDPYMGNPLNISSQYAGMKTHRPAVAYNWKRREYLVVWHTSWVMGSRDIRARRISDRGQLLGDEFVVFEHVTKDSAQPDVAYDPVNDRYLVVFVHDVSGNGSDWDVYGRFVSWNGQMVHGPAFAICSWSTKQWNPKVAYGRAPQEYLVVWWTEGVGGVKSYVSGRRVWANGSGFPTGAFAIASHPTLNRVGPDVAYNMARNEYLVIWDAVNASRDIYGVRLNASGAAIGGGEFGIAGWPSNETTPSVAACSAADQYLVVWQADSGSPTFWDIYGRYVKGDGTVDSVHQLAGTTGDEVSPHVACSAAAQENHTGTQYLVAYEQEYSNGRYGIRARFVASNKVFRTTFAFVPAGSTTDRLTPATAGGMGRFLTVWVYQRDADNQDIRGRLALPGAQFLPLELRKK